MVRLYFGRLWPRYYVDVSRSLSILARVVYSLGIVICAQEEAVVHLALNTVSTTNSFHSIESKRTIIICYNLGEFGMLAQLSSLLPW